MLAERVRQLDPTRPVTAGVQGVNPKKDEYMAALDVAGYNYAFKWNEGHQLQKTAYVDDHERHPERVIIGTESFASQAFDYWMPAIDYPWVIGDFVWTGWDYLGESSIGWIGFGFPVYWPVAYCGDIGITGLRRPQSYYRGALFGNDALAAFVRRPEPLFSHIRRYDWGADDVQASWTWPGQEGKNLTVCIYSSCDEVELFLNGKSLGRRPTTRAQQFRAEFGVHYQPGSLKAVGYKNGKAVARMHARDRRQAGRHPPAIPSAPPWPPTVSRWPMCRLRWWMPRAGSIRTPTTWCGSRSRDPVCWLPSAMAIRPACESFQQPQRKAWQGCGLVILKSSSKPGRIRVTATSDGLAPATAEIETR